MMQKGFPRIKPEFFISVFIIIILSGCSFQPKVNFKKIPVNKFKNLNYDNTTFKFKWWKYFKDPDLDLLLEKTLKHNQDIRIALKRMEQADKEILIKKSLLFPNVSFSAKRTKSKQQLHDLPPFIPSVIETRLYDVNLMAGYEVDFWGKYRNIIAMAKHNRKISGYALENIMKTVVSNVILSFYNVKFLKQEVELIKNKIKLWEDEKELVQARYMEGLSPLSAIYQIDTEIFREKSLLPAMEALIEINKYVINVLAGNIPEKSLKIKNGIIDVKRLKLPSDLPSEVLLRRPDMKLFVEKIFSQANFIGSSTADIFPAFKLTGRYGFENSDLKSLIRNSSSLYSWFGEIFATVFDFGAKINRVKEAKEKLEELKIEYYKKVLRILKDVESSIVNFHSLMKKNRLIETRKRYLERIIDIKKSDYERGIADIREIYQLKREKNMLQLEIISNENKIITAYIKCLKEMGY